MAEDMRSMRSTAGIAEFERGYEVPDCVVLDSTYSSMGRMVAVRACAAAGWAYHDSVTLLELVPECGVAIEDVERLDARLAKGSADLAAVRVSDEFARIWEAYVLGARRALDAGPCLIHDRLSRAAIEGLGHRCVAVLSCAFDARAMRVRTRFSPKYAGLATDAELDAAAAAEDDVRRSWHALVDGATVWAEPAAYDLVLNTDHLGRDFAAKLLALLMQG
ncbi:MAG: hypothetical protein J6S63_03065 [Atopobiaceae bacterium]|nr:hypothetical protein [Atopobiaceae bacterium]